MPKVYDDEKQDKNVVTNWTSWNVLPIAIFFKPMTFYVSQCFIIFIIYYSQ